MRIRRRGDSSDQKPCRPRRDCQSQQPAHRPDEQTFHGELAQQPRAAGAQGSAHRKLPVADHAAGQQQVGYVGAGNQKHEPGHGAQSKQRRLRIPLQDQPAARARFQLEFLGEEVVSRIGRKIGEVRNLFFGQRPAERLQGSFSLRLGHAGFESADHGEPVVVPIGEPVPVGRHLRLHHQGNENVRSAPHLDAGKPRLGHSNHRQRSIVHQDGLVQHGGVAAQSALPVAVAQHDNGMRPRHAVVFRAEDAAQRRAHAEHLEIISADEFALSALRASVEGHTETHSEASQDAGETGVAIPYRGENGIGNGFARISIGPHASDHRP